MKRIICLAFLALCLVGCGVTSPKPSEKFTVSVFMDYRPYANEGFFISPDPYPGEFTSLGELLLNIYPARVPAGTVKFESKSKYEDAVYTQHTEGGLVSYPIDSSELMDEFVTKAKALGGDGVSGFKCKVIYSGIYQNELDHYELSGLVIDRH